MIDEAMGKILGMAMAYVASAMGMFVAYVNYRKRIVKAERVMTPAAWAVIAVTVLATLCGTVIVAQMTRDRPTEPAAPLVERVAEAIEQEAPPAVVETTQPRPGWSWIGIVLPAAIFLFATVVTAALHRHFSAHGH
jgi:hypothetical protein